MSNVIDRLEVQRMLADGSAQLVEVLPHDEYDSEHIEGAINIPLKEVAAGADRLGRDRPVIVYCNDFQWDLAPRAAARLETLGFDKVHEYQAGKQDWLAAGLPFEGRSAAEPAIGAVMRRDVPRFGLQDRAGVMLESLKAGSWEWGAVVNESGILLGRIRSHDVVDPEARASEVMDEGPGTYRPNVPLDELLARMFDKGFDLAFVTDPDGRLRGLVARRDISRAMAAHRKAS